MKIIYSECIFQKFFKNISPYYILIGNLEFLVKSSKDLIFILAKKHGFLKSSIVEFECNLKTNNLLLNVSSYNFIDKKQIILIKYNQRLTETIIKKDLSQLNIYLNSNILLIIHINIINIKISNNIWIKIFKKSGTIIFCNSISNSKFKIWTNHKIQDMNLNFTYNAKKILLKHYQGNILDLCNVINIISLIWTKKTISTSLIKKIIYNLSISTPIQWIDTILLNDFKSAIETINQFIYQKINPILLVRYLQYDLLNILLIKRSQSNTINSIFNQRKIWKNRQLLLVNFSKNITMENLYKCIRLLTLIECTIKTRNSKFIWIQLKTLTEIMCQTYSK